MTKYVASVMIKRYFTLTGRDFPTDDAITAEKQVDLLIKQATSHENLCQCYIGWFVSCFLLVLPNLLSFQYITVCIHVSPPCPGTHSARQGHHQQINMSNLDSDFDGYGNSHSNQ